MQGEVMPASEKAPVGWRNTIKFKVVLQAVGLNTTELNAYCQERGLYPQQVRRWRQATQETTERQVLTLSSAPGPERDQAAQAKFRWKE